MRITYQSMLLLGIAFLCATSAFSQGGGGRGRGAAGATGPVQAPLAGGRFKT